MRFIPRPLTQLSILANRMLGGKKGWSICATLYHKKCEDTLLGKFGVYLVDKLFYWDYNHCRKAYMLRKKN